MKRTTAVRTLRQFYQRFEEERAVLLAHLQNTHLEPDCSSHTTMLLIRLMFSYFLQDVSEQEQDILLEFKTRPELAQICAFFDQYQWCLDEQQNEYCVQPDVLGYVFEQQVNQKQMGAYYTQRDVTDYIVQRTILPYLLDTVVIIHPSLFVPTQTIWQLLCTQPERYIHPALCSTAYLPLETEREYSIRQARYTMLSTMLQQGQVCTVAEMINHNLDIRRFVLDCIETCNDPSLLLALYTTLEQMSILDPTCGTGAFLLAAMALLIELYTTCFERMRQLVEAQDQCGHDAAESECHAIFRTLLAQSTPHFMYKSLISNNLYGIDIMPEAVEVCKMQLTLVVVGTNLSRPADISIGDENAINWSLQWNIRVGNALTDETWRMAFPEHCDGFDVIIGNPPYVEYNKVTDAMAIGIESRTYGNIYAEIVERSLMRCRVETSYLGLIVPLSICGGERFAALRRTIVMNTSALWLANFDIFPCHLFEGAYQRLTLLLGKHSMKQPHTHETYVTHIQRWYTSERATLIERIFYTHTRYRHKDSVFPKLASEQQEDILQKIVALAENNTLSILVSPLKTEHVVYYQEATNTWMKATRRTPYYKKNGIVTRPPHGRLLYFKDDRTASIVCALMNSSLFYLWFATYSDGFHLSHALVQSFPVDNALCSNEHLLQLAHCLEEDIQRHAVHSTRNTRRGDSIEIEEYRMVCSKSLLDEIDCVLARQYGFTDEELTFIVQYDNKYRIGKI